MFSSKEAVLLILDENKNVVGFVKYDIQRRSNVFYSCSEMGIDEIESLFKKIPLNQTTKNGTGKC